MSGWVLHSAHKRRAVDLSEDEDDENGQMFKGGWIASERVDGGDMTIGIRWRDNMNNNNPLPETFSREGRESGIFVNQWLNENYSARVDVISSPSLCCCSVGCNNYFLRGGGYVSRLHRDFSCTGCWCCLGNRFEALGGWREKIQLIYYFLLWYFIKCRKEGLNCIIKY